MLSYFDAKRELKKIYQLSIKAMQRKDSKYINYLLSNLDQLEVALIDKFELSAFGRYVLNKDIKKMKMYLNQKR